MLIQAGHFSSWSSCNCFLWHSFYGWIPFLMLTISQSNLGAFYELSAWLCSKGNGTSASYAVPPRVYHFYESQHPYLIKSKVTEVPIMMTYSKAARHGRRKPSFKETYDVEKQNLKKKMQESGDPTGQKKKRVEKSVQWLMLHRE